MRNLTHRGLKSEHFVPKIKGISSNFQESAGETRKHENCAYACIVKRKCKTPN